MCWSPTWTQGRDLAKCLGKNSVALMRGHGFASAARSLIEVVRMSVYLPRNARAQMRAKQLGGEIKYLSQGEIDARNAGYSPYSNETWRAWEYWANKAGCGHLLTRPDGGAVNVHDHKHEHKIAGRPCETGPDLRTIVTVPHSDGACLRFAGTAQSGVA